MSADRFLDHLESQGLLDAGAIRSLRKQVAGSRVAVTPEAVAKLLVDGGHLTAFQAKKLLSEVGSAPRTGSKPSPAEPAAPSDDLGLAPLAGDPAVPSKPAPSTSKPTSKPSNAKSESRKSESGKSQFRTPAKAVQPPPTAGELTPANAAGSGLTPMDGGLMPLGDPGLAPMGGFDDGLTSMGTPGTPGSVGQSAGPAEQQVVLGFRKKRSQSFGTSKLILFGVPSLLFLALLSWLLISVFTKGNARNQFTRAETLFKDQAYAQAIKEYDLYLKANPSGDDASTAKVRKALASIRLATEGARDMRSGFETASRVLPEVEKEPAFGSAREDLKALLPKIAGGFGKQAKDAPDRKRAQEFVDFADLAMNLVNNPSYIPTKNREDIQGTLDDINKNIGLAKRTIQKDIALEEALNAIQTSVAEGNTVAAYATRGTLIRDFPELELDKTLEQAVGRITERERSLVKSYPEAKTSERTDVNLPGRSLRLIPSRRIGQNIAGVDNQVVFLLIRGSVFGIDAASGQILWRRNVGPETQIQPLPISKLSGADAIVSDSRRQELLRLKSRTGEVVWRFAVGEPFAAPVVVEDRILISAFSGKLYQLDLEQGNSTLACQLPQTLTVGVGGNPRMEQVYQVGNHSNIYVLNPTSLSCTEVYFLGHRSGSIAVPPVMALQHLFVVENSGPDYCELHILAADEKGANLRPIREKVRLAGNVVIPLVHTKNRVTVLTNFGEIRVFAVDPSNEEKPVRTDAAMSATSNAPVPGYHVVDGASVLVGGDRFSAFDIQTAREQLNRRWSLHESETFVAPLLKVGNAVIHTRRRRGSAGVTVSAALVDSGAVIWRTDLAVPAPILSYDPARSQLLAVNSLGDVYRLALKDGTAEKPNEVVEVDGAEVAFSFSDPAPLADGRVVLSNQRDRAQILVFNPQLETGSARTIRMDVGDAKANVAPISLGNLIILPLDSGQVFAYSPDTGKAAALPFQPQLEPGVKVNWRQPAVVGNEFILTDGAKRLYRVGLKEQPQPHLEQLALGSPTNDLVGGVAIAGDTLYGVVRGATGDLIQAFNLSDLANGQEHPLTGRVSAGPWQVGDVVLLASSKEGLVCFEGGQNKRWQVPLSYGPLAGPPRLDRGELLLTSQTGTVWRISLSDGAELNRMETGDSLVGSAIAIPSGVLVSSIDGSWIAVQSPKAGETPVGSGP